MLEKIEKFQPWLIVILVTLIFHLLFVLLMELTGAHSWFERYIYIFALPSFQIMSSSIIASIREFSGDTILPAQMVHHVSIAGIGVLVIFVIAPFLLIKGYIKAEKTSNMQRGIAWYVGACILMVTVGVTSVNLFVSTQVYFNLQDSIENNKENDGLRHELVKLALDAATLNVLPAEMGGGNGTFTHFMDENGDAKPIQLEQLKSYASKSSFDFIIHPMIKDSSITIVGVSDNEGRNENFKNMNGETGKKQMSVKVHPYKENIFHMDKDSLSNY